MANQGRLIKVMFLLLVAITTGALVLLGFEGRPIEPMAFSLSGQSRLTPVYKVLGTEKGIAAERWERIEVSYDREVGDLSGRFDPEGVLCQKYHFIIVADAQGRGGCIYASSRWVKQRSCLNSSRSPLAQRTIRVCLAGNPQDPIKSPQRQQQLENLTSSLIRHCQLKPTDIQWIKHTHRD